MSGHESAGPHKGMFYPSSAGTLTCVKSLSTTTIDRHNSHMDPFNCSNGPKLAHHYSDHVA
jgi:hypothetical protein